MKIIKFTENNDWEGEVWTRFMEVQDDQMDHVNFLIEAFKKIDNIEYSLEVTDLWSLPTDEELSKMESDDIDCDCDAQFDSDVECYCNSTYYELYSNSTFPEDNIKKAIQAMKLEPLSSLVVDNHFYKLAIFE